MTRCSQVISSPFLVRICTFLIRIQKFQYFISVSRKIASSPGCVSETVTIAIAYIDNYEIKVKTVSDGGVIVDRILVKRNDVYTWLRNKENEGYAMTASTLAALYYLSEESE